MYVIYFCVWFILLNFVIMRLNLIVVRLAVYFRYCLLVCLVNISVPSLLYLLIYLFRCWGLSLSLYTGDVPPIHIPDLAPLVDICHKRGFYERSWACVLVNIVMCV